VSDTRLRVAVAALSALGAAIAAYLTVVKLSHAPLVCGTGGCEIVQSSRYSEVGGVPISAFGLAAYVALLASTLSASETARLAGAAVGLAAAVVAIYLVYLQLAVIDAVCVWCTTSDSLMIVLAPLTLLRAGAASRQAA
jgi:uncharacterized membrane protein